MGFVMIGFALLLFPFVLLGFVLLMGRVEEPLSQVASEREIERFLEDANREELNTFVREGTESALSRFRSRLSFVRFRRGARRAADETPDAGLPAPPTSDPAGIADPRD
jgi:hypothetical protein